MPSKLNLRLLLSANVLALSALQCQSSNNKQSTSGGPSSTASAKTPAPATQTPSTASAALRGSQTAPGAAPSSGTTAGPAGAKAASTTPSTAKPLEDSQIAAITDSESSAEIDQGKLAQTKAKDTRVRAFAKMMVDKYSQERRDQEKIQVAKTDSPDSQRTARDASAALQSLRGKTGTDFDKAYVQLQVDEQAKGLATLNKELLPAAHDKQLKAYLEKIKPDMESQLTRAEQLQRDLGVGNDVPAKNGASAGHAKTASSAASSVAGGPPASTH